MANILAIGAHCGDVEISCGGVLVKHALAGDKVTILHLTLGEKGHPHLSPYEYAKQKKEEALKAGQILGAEVKFLDYHDGELPVSDEVKYKICDIIREVKPTSIITHWKESIHKDHKAAHLNVVDAIFFAALPSFERELPAHRITALYYAENWEDAQNFQPYIYIDITNVYPKWIEGVLQYELFRGTVSKFPYLEYYKALFTIRGTQIGCQYACAFDIEPLGKKRVLELLP